MCREHTPGLLCKIQSHVPAFVTLPVIQVSELWGDPAVRVRRRHTICARRQHSICASANSKRDVEKNFRGRPRKVNRVPPVRLQHIPLYLGRRKHSIRTRPSADTISPEEPLYPTVPPQNCQQASTIASQMRRAGNYSGALSVLAPFLDIHDTSISVLYEYILAYAANARGSNPPLSPMTLFEDLLRTVQEFPGKPNSRVIGAVLSSIRTSEPSLTKHVLRKALDLVDYTRSNEISLSSYNLATLFQLCSDAHDIETAIKLKQDVSTNLDIISGSALVACFARCGDIGLADATIKELTTGGVPVNERTFTPLVAAYYRAGLHTKVLSTMELALKFQQGDSTIFLFSAVLRSCGKVGDAVNAKRYFEKMVQEAVRPTEDVLNSVLNAAINGGDVQLAIDVLYKRMPAVNLKPTRDQINQVVAMCGRVGAKGGGGQKMVFHILHTMQSDLDVSPDIGTYNAVISSLGRTRNAQAARYVLEHEIPAAKLEPNVLSFNATIHACGQVGRVYESFELLCKMKEDALLLPTQSTYNSILSQCVQARDKNLLALVLQRMESENGIKLESVSVTSLIQMCRAQKDPDSALRILSTFKKHNGRNAFLDTTAYNSLLTVCLELDRVDFAKGIAGYLLVSHRANVGTFNILIRHRCKQLMDIDGGVKLLKRMKSWGIAPDTITYSVLIQTCASNGSLDRGFRLLSEMQDVGLGCTDTYPWTSLIDGCGRAGQWERGLELLERMRSRNRDEFSHGLVPAPTTATYNAAIYAASMGGGGWSAVLDVYAMLKADEQKHPDHVTFSAMTSAILEHQRLVREQDVVNEVLRGLLQEEKRFLQEEGDLKNLHLRRQRKKIKNKAKRLQWFLQSFTSQLRPASTST